MNDLLEVMDDVEVQEDMPTKHEAETVLTIVEADTRRFELKQREAKLLGASTLVPKQYQGNVADIVVAMNMATRMNADPLMVMQSLHIIHGKPGWSAQFLIASFNSCGRFSAIHYEFSDDGQECVAVTTERATGREVRGPKVTTEMAKAEGWSTKSGSKWKTMPELMLRYRAAAFLIRTTAPEIGLGLYTTDELKDINDAS